MKRRQPLQRSTKRPTRYSARFKDACYGKPVELYIGTNLEIAIRRAKKHHVETGERSWVWNTRTGETVYRSPEEMAVVAGGAN